MQTNATANPVLAGFYQQFMRDPAGFIAEAIAPTFNSGLQSAQYYVFSRENQLQVPTKIGRAPGAPHVEVGMKLSDDNYFCENYGLKIPVPDEDRKKYATALDADIAAMRRVADIIKVNRELRVQKLVTDVTQIANASPATKWNIANSTPKDDVNAGKESVRKAIGLRVNTMIISETVRLVLEQHPTIMKMFQLTVGGVLTMDMLKVYFGIQNISVAGTILATSKEGQAVTSDDIWTDTVVLGHVEPGQDLMLPNFARTVNWTDIGTVEGEVETWRDSDRKSTMHSADHSTDEKLTGADAGFILTDTLA
ncbi:MAG TPA: hypothetical protein VHX90_07640 [Verrucomicrobiae bacterium]|jgi:hypothetical protein|nr:hypothetical protein [Verrucomicrobiae bacterium]